MRETEIGGGRGVDNTGVDVNRERREEELTIGPPHLQKQDAAQSQRQCHIAWKSWLNNEGAYRAWK